MSRPYFQNLRKKLQINQTHFSTEQFYLFYPFTREYFSGILIMIWDEFQHYSFRNWVTHLFFKVIGVIPLPWPQVIICKCPMWTRSNFAQTKLRVEKMDKGKVACTLNLHKFTCWSSSQRGPFHSTPFSQCLSFVIFLFFWTLCKTEWIDDLKWRSRSSVKTKSELRQNKKDTWIIGIHNSPNPACFNACRWTML